MRIELSKPSEFERPRTPEEIPDKLEERIGSKGREIFENFVREINRLQAEQQAQLEQGGNRKIGECSRKCVTVLEVGKGMFDVGPDASRWLAYRTLASAVSLTL
jgi:hypothetical protein